MSVSTFKIDVIIYQMTCRDIAYRIMAVLKVETDIITSITFYTIIVFC